MSEFTPGPWRARGGHWVSNTADKFIADCAGAGTPECAANARLIAAAPELVRLVEWALEFVPDYADNWVAEAKTTLAKALGQPVPHD